MSNLKTIKKIEQIFENAMKGNACVHIDLKVLTIIILIFRL
jgi:hypothetical protein